MDKERLINALAEVGARAMLKYLDEQGIDLVVRRPVKPCTCSASVPGAWFPSIHSTDCPKFNLHFHGENR